MSLRGRLFPVAARQSSALRCRAPALTRFALASPRTTLSSNILCSPALLQQQHMQQRWCSGGAAPTEEKAAPPEDKEPSTGPNHVYEGAKNKVVKTIKTVSIANLGFAVASAPLLQYITQLSGSPGKGIAMSSLLLFFGGGTTGALTWATTTYVLSIYSVPGKDALMITTPTLTGGTKETEVAWADITRPIGYHPFATFEADGRKYYMDELGDMHDETFPERLEEALNN